MKLSFRWYGEEDKVTLEQIRQIPGMESIVTAVYDVPVGQVWSRESIARLKALTETAGLKFEVKAFPFTRTSSWASPAGISTSRITARISAGWQRLV